MRNSRGGLGDIPSLGKAGALPASAQSRRVKARGQVCGPKGRPFRQRVNAVCRALPRYDLTPEHRGRHYASRGRLGPSAWIGRRRSARPAPPGERFIVYKLDYGCYVDLINTDKYPEGLLLTDSSQLFVDFDVPVDDGRSYRRAILDLEQFYALNQTISH